MNIPADSAARPELTVLMPCLNEAETVGVCVQKARDCMDKMGVSGEVVVADNGSTDGSRQIAEDTGARVVNVPIRGYGAALYYGALEARGRFVIMGDADDSYDFLRLSPFLERLRSGDDLVMGNRFRGGIAPGAMPWKNRWIGNPVLTGIGRLFFRCAAKDFHCGLRGFSRAAFQRMDLQTTGMEFASEMVIKATLLGMKISEVPTTLSPDGRSRSPHLKPWRDGWRHLRFMLLYAPRWLYLYPGLLLVMIGMIVGIWLWKGPRNIGRVQLDVHTMVYAMVAVLIGFQAISFAVSAKIFAIQSGVHPPDPRLNRLFKYVTLEIALFVGGILLLSGIAGSIAALYHWNTRSFGPLDYVESMRIVIPSAVGLTLGFQVIMNGFFLSMLGLRIRRMPTPDEESLGK